MGGCFSFCVLSIKPRANIDVFKYKNCWFIYPKIKFMMAILVRYFYRFKQIKLTFRMFGYDSPEIKPSRQLPNRDKIKKKAIKAKEFLADQIGDKVIWAEIKGFDKYGRVLADFYIKNMFDKIHINKLMIEKKHGIPYFGGTKSTSAI